MQLDFTFMLKTFIIALKALPVTFTITAVSLLAAAPFAFFMALCIIYKVKVLRQLSALYISFIRGTPIVLQILIVYSLVPSLLNWMCRSMGSSFNVFDINPIIYACIVFTLNNAAYLAELFRSALLAVDKGQHEAALASGLTVTQSYIRIVIPQAMASAMPNLCNLIILLIKNTSLCFIMTVKDITAAAKIAASYKYNYIEAYLDIFVMYIVICLVVQVLFKIKDKR